ncbi:MAG: hypothetical protein ACLU8D_04210 [Enterocloster sp.]
MISDCTVNTGDSLNARIQGGGYVGGITGFQNDTDIFNVHVMGSIGGSGSQAIGGVTGKYASGKMKVARFEGRIASSGLGSSAREGTFIGTHDTGFHFRYGTEAGADLAYLFADTEEKSWPESAAPGSRTITGLAMTPISASGTGRTMGLLWSRDRAPGRRRNGTSMRSWRKERFM